jgi:hypothetical protein
MKLQKLFLLAFVLLGSMSVSMAQSDEDALKATLLNYLDGGTDGDTARFNRAFIPQAIQRSVGKDGKISQMSVRDLVSKIKPGEKLSRTTRIVNWSYAGTAASAVTETEYETSKLIDLLNLLKVNGEWKIVSRVFSRIDKGAMVSSSSPSVQMNSTPVSASSTNSKVQPAAATAKKPAAKPKPVSDDGWE